MDDEIETAPAAVEPPWWRPARPSGRRRQPLTRDAIVEAAVKIVDAEGVDALTVRRLGEALDTGSATLYWYIGGKDELAELVYDHVMGEVELPDPDPEHWEAQLKEFVWRCYRVLLRHNDVVRFSLGRIPVGPNMLRIMEWSLGLLRAANLPDAAVGYFGDIVGRYLDASVLEVTSHGGPPPEDVGRYFASLPAAQFPNMRSLSASMFEGSDDDRFEFGLDLLLRGMRSYFDDARATKPPATS